MNFATVLISGVSAAAGTTLTCAAFVAVHVVQFGSPYMYQMNVEGDLTKSSVLVPVAVCWAIGMVMSGLLGLAMGGVAGRMR